MNKKIVLGIIPADAAETAINNLTEADYNEKDISLVMQNNKTARQIMNDYGPLKKTTLTNIHAKLTKLKVDTGSQQIYSDALTNGSALLAIICPKENVETTKAMLADYKATHVVIV